MKLVKIGRVNDKVKEMAMNDGACLADVIKASGIVIGENDDISIDGGGPITNLSSDINDRALIIIRPKVRYRHDGNSFDSEPAVTKFAMIVWNISHAPDIKVAEKIAYNHRVFLESIGIR